MNIKKRKITNKIFLLIFENQHDISSTFLRFQEFYESPKFKGKFFTLEEFKHWYIENSPKGKKTGKFTYYSDWNGFNIPSHILKPFYSGKFNPLSKKEKQLLDFFRRKKFKFYIIGIHKGVKNVSSLLTQEVAHGLFFTDFQYKKDVLEILKEFDLKNLKKEIITKGSYHEDVLDDECHAYALSSGKKIKTNIPKDLKNRLNILFDKYLEKRKSQKTA